MVCLYQTGPRTFDFEQAIKINAGEASFRLLGVINDLVTNTQ